MYQIWTVAIIQGMLQLQDTILSSQLTATLECNKKMKLASKLHVSPKFMMSEIVLI